MHQFYLPQIDVSVKTIVLPEEESHHCKVLRIKKGEKVRITDGRGTVVRGFVIDNNFKACVIKIEEICENYNKRPYFLHIAIAPPKSSDRLEWFVEKAVEIGIDKITPVLTRFGERKKIKIERLQKIAISALKQSKNAYLPQIEPMRKLEDFLKQDLDCQKFIAVCNAEKKFKDIKFAEKILFLVGPEGGFSEQEIEMAEKSGFEKIVLTNNILRTETAGVFITSVVSTKF